eukprot:1088422-Alexandrium_andersonii.AAC.1
MSASLVGSEMCIRDRRWQTSAFRALRAPEAASRRRRRIWLASNGAERPCLLYTSDAADDM